MFQAGGPIYTVKKREVMPTCATIKAGEMMTKAKIYPHRALVICLSRSRRNRADSRKCAPYAAALVGYVGETLSLLLKM